MPVTLAEAKLNTQDDLDATVIDEFRKESALLDSLIFDDVVSPTGNGTLTYSYRRLATQATAATRAIGTGEYAASEVTTTKHSVELAVMGGKFGIDRVLADLGPTASGGIAVNMAQKIKATNTKFQDEAINGDKAVDANGFDGLDKALTGSSTEFRPTATTDWSDLDTSAATKFTALDALDEFLSLLDGSPTLLLGNQKLLSKIRGIVRRTGAYVVNPVDGLIGANGRPINREEYGGVVFADMGNKAGSNSPIIPIETRTIASVSTTNLTDLYAVRIGLDGFHGCSMLNGKIVRQWLPDFSTEGAIKNGEVELGPVGVALKATKAAAVFRNIKVA